MDPKDVPRDPPASPPPAAPYLQYTNRPPPPSAADPLMTALHFATGFITYASLLLAIKLLSVRFRWDLSAICGTWVVVILISFGTAGWLAGAYGWRAAMAGVIVAFIISLFISAMIVGEA